MFERVLRRWGRLIGWPQEAKTVVEDRRVWVRVPSDREITFQLATEAKPLAARVQDISLGGISLVVGYPCEIGGLLNVELPGADDGCSTTVLAYVVRVAMKAPGEWAVGCTFATELSDEDLSSFGAKRVKPPATDQRAWVRFPSDARATYQKVREPQAEPKAAQILNLAPTGAGLLVAEVVEAGDLLTVDLRDAHGAGGLTIMASVTRVTARGNGERAIGCTFIRALTEREVEVFA